MEKTTRPIEYFIQAHEASGHSAEALVGPNQPCGCFHCGEIYSTGEIPPDAISGGAAICPFCGMDTVLPESAGFPLNAVFLERMRIIFFSPRS